MPDDQGRYSRSERASYVPEKGCPDCGERHNILVQWAPAEALSDPPGADLAIPGSMTCLTCQAKARD